MERGAHQAIPGQKPKRPPKRPSRNGPSPLLPVARLLLPALVAALVTAGAGVTAAPEERGGERGTVHWSYRAPRRPVPPAVRDPDRARGAIDRFVSAGLEARGIRPSPETDRPTLVRRLKLDLLGLPPTPDEVDAFVRDARPDAYERLVDRFLASPAFGEHWGRRWLDLARYGDSDGYEKDRVRPHAWRYRDWLIDAVNRDLPFDRFTIEQLAGDLIPDTGTDARIATGFHRNTLHNTEGGADPEEDRVKKTVDRVNTTGAVWLGLTVGCAECHSHKYDELRQEEYYGLFAFFNNLEEIDLPVPLPGEAPPGTKAQMLAEATKRRKTHLHIRGDFLRKGPEVEPHTPGVLHPFRPRGETPDRLDLARWLLDPGNPLTPRVEVNRIWAHLFGHGLVRTLDDFGVRGEAPSHPRLLDWLAAEIITRGWSRKAIIRLIVLSATYRQSSRWREDLAALDPENRLLARQNRLRLDAETIRDAHLAASGLLCRRIGGPGVRPPLPEGVAELGYAGSVKWPESRGQDRFRRGIYIFRQRTVPYPMLTTFDAPDGTTTCARRERSNTPLQALTLLNDPVFTECAHALARRLLAESDGALTDRERIERAFRIAIGRFPGAGELDRLERTLRELRQIAGSDPGATARLARGAGPDAVEAAAWVAMSRVLFNLDEFITRE